MALPGLSILPPGRDWSVLPLSPQENIPPASLIRFSRKLEGAPTAGRWRSRMVFGVVVVLALGELTFNTPTEFLEFFAGKGDGKIRSGQMATQRQRYVEFEAALDDSLKATCVKYHRLTEVAATQGFPDSVAMNSTYGFYCLHPHWPQYAVDLTYSQLYAKGQEPLTLGTEREQFLKSLVFDMARPTAAPDGTRRAEQ